MSREKIESALSAALKHLEDSIAALSNNDEYAFSDSLWSASAETEYAVFLLSLKLENKTEDASWKGSSLTKQLTEFKPALNTALKLLRSAKTSLERGQIKSHEEAWTARNLLLKAQELLEKKRKETKKHVT